MGKNTDNLAVFSISVWECHGFLITFVPNVNVRVLLAQVPLSALIGPADRAKLLLFHRHRAAAVAVIERPPHKFLRRKVKIVVSQHVKLRCRPETKKNYVSMEAFFELGQSVIIKLPRRFLLRRSLVTQVPEKLAAVSGFMPVVDSDSSSSDSSDEDDNDFGRDGP